MDGPIQPFGVSAVLNGFQLNFDQWKLLVCSYILKQLRKLYDNQKKSLSEIESCVLKRSPFISGCHSHELGRSARLEVSAESARCVTNRSPIPRLHCNVHPERVNENKWSQNRNRTKVNESGT